MTRNLIIVTGSRKKLVKDRNINIALYGVTELKTVSFVDTILLPSTSNGPVRV